MPQIKSAKKELRKNKVRAARKKVVKDDLGALLKNSRIAIEKKILEEAGELVKQSLKALDKAAQKGVIKKNTSSRKKSRLQKKLNKLNSAK